MHRAIISGTGLYAPERVVENSYFNDLYKKDIDTFLRKERNIERRRFMSEDQSTSDLIIPAAESALTAAGIKASDLDLIIVATDTPDYLSPSTAAVVQFRLGAKRAGVFDLNSACAGFVIALDTASKFIQSDERYQNILVVGAYGMSKYLDWKDYKTSSLFADGAGAVVLRSSNSPGVLAAQLYADGQYHDYMGIYAGGTRLPLSEEVLSKGQNLLSFAKKIPIETNITHWPRIANLLLDRANAKATDVKAVFCTQLNIQTINTTLDALGLPHNLSHNIMHEYGYTGSACIPMAIADAAAKRKLNKGDLILLLSSGGGISIAGMALRWAYDCA